MNATQTPVLKFVDVGGVRLAYFERGAPRDDMPTLFLVHATGFHGRVWDQIIDRLPGVHSIALEQRGHGRSDNVAVEHWRTFGEDQASVVRMLGLADAIGIGHSMGAHGLIECAAASGAFDRLLLLDPTVSAPEQYTEENARVLGSALHGASRRRNRFSSAEDFRARIERKSAFPRFHSKILMDYCTHGIEPDGDGAYRLLCRPEIEARVYMTARSNGGVYDSVRGLDIPVTVVRAQAPTKDEAGFSASPTWPNLSSAFPRGRDIHLHDCTHFIPMERPDFVVEQIREAIAAWQQARD